MEHLLERGLVVVHRDRVDAHHAAGLRPSEETVVPPGRRVAMACSHTSGWPIASMAGRRPRPWRPAQRGQVDQHEPMGPLPWTTTASPRQIPRLGHAVDHGRQGLQRRPPPRRARARAARRCCAPPPVREPGFAHEGAVKEQQVLTQGLPPVGAGPAGAARGGVGRDDAHAGTKLRHVRAGHGDDPANS